MKRFWIIWIVNAMILSSIALVDSIEPQNCPDDQTILKLARSYNAHAEVWDGSNNYAYRICFNNSFQGNYNGPNPHECAGNNLVLNLSRLTNAHADGPGEGRFNVSVCYGDLRCTILPSDAGCQSSGGQRGAKILDFSAEQNAHLALVGADYGYSLCCFSSILPRCNGDGYCDAGEDYSCVDDNCGSYCNNDGIRDTGFEDCDCGGGQCIPSQLGGEDCSTLYPGYGGTLGCTTDQCTFDNGGCLTGGTDNFCAVNAGLGNFMYGGVGTDCPNGNCVVQYCEQVNSMTGPGLTNMSFRRQACQECGEWAHPAQDADSAYCDWNSTLNQCSTINVYAGGLECRQDWIQEGDCNAEGTTRQVLVNYTRMRGEGNCPAAETITIPCSTAVQLPFFSKTSAIISAVIIAVIYLIYIKLKK